MPHLTLEEVAAAHDEVFAPWVRALGVEAVEIGAALCRFRLPGGADLTRRGGPGGGVVCGQAVGAAADTASVLALAAVNGRLRPCTTVDLTAHFLRPLAEGEAEIAVHVLSNGRRMAATRAEFRSVGSAKLAATVTCAFAWLED